MKKFMHLLFIICAVCTMLESYFISGMFSGPLMCLLMFVIGLAAAAVSMKNHAWALASLYLLATLALCLPYVKLMF